MRSKRYTDEFKKEEIKQVTEGGYPAWGIAHSLYAWLRKAGIDRESRNAEKQTDLAVENARLSTWEGW